MCRKPLKTIPIQLPPQIHSRLPTHPVIDVSKTSQRARPLQANLPPRSTPYHHHTPGRHNASPCCDTSRRIPHHQKHAAGLRMQTTRAYPSQHHVHQQQQQRKHKQPTYASIRQEPSHPGKAQCWPVVVIRAGGSHPTKSTQRAHGACRHQGLALASLQ
jgi:hypothetical protein